METQAIQLALSGGVCTLILVLVAVKWYGVYLSFKQTKLKGVLAIFIPFYGLIIGLVAILENK